MTRTTRLAPSPTGALHLGNARTFLATWAHARQQGWRILLRIDDLDGPRIRKGADRQAIDILQWLGMDWDEGPVYESASLDAYQGRLIDLASRGLIYPCRCTRKQIAEASLSAPHAGEHELRYPGTCRPPALQDMDFQSVPSGSAAWRFRVPEGSIGFVDELAGPCSVDVQSNVGDFLVTNKDGIASYQLACVVDDELGNVTDVLRGNDLIESTPRQMLLARALGCRPIRYWHLPLVVGKDGLRLAKRHGDTTIESYRQAGVPAGRIRGLIASWCGMEKRQSLDAGEFLESFSIRQVPGKPVVFSESDHSWLLEC